MRVPSITVGVARWSARHPWSAIGLWFVLVVAAFATMATVPTQQADQRDLQVGQAGEASAMVAEAGLAQAQVESVLLTGEAPLAGEQLRQQATAAARELTAGLAGLPAVSSVGEALWSPDETALLVPVVMAGEGDEVEQDLPALAVVTDRVAAQYPDLRIEQTGEASVNRDIWERVGEDLVSAETISLPLTFLILVVAFGALVAAGIPLLLALTSIMVTLGLYAPLSLLIPDSGSVASVVVMIGLAVGVDYSLLYLKRERAERRRGHGTLEAIELAAASAGRAVVLSGGAVMVAMAGLFLARDTVFDGLAIGAILVVGTTVVGSLTVLPALLAKLGHRVDKARVPLLWRLNQRIGTGGISGRLVAPVLRFPVAAAVLAVAALLAVSAPALGMRLHSSTLDTVPQGLPAVEAAQRLQAEFPTERPAIEVVLTGGSAEDLRSDLAQVARRAAAEGLGSGEETAVAEDGRTALLTLAAPAPEGDPENARAIERLRDEVLPATVGDGVDWAVGGGEAVALDSEANQQRTLPLVIGFVLLLTLLIMWRCFRSVGVALLTTVLNLLSVGAAFGVMVVVFQGSWADGLLVGGSPGFLIDWVPLFCFVVLVGLSMDYHVFVLSRVREHLRAGVAHRDAVRLGITETASVVTSAAAVMVSVFLAYGFLSMLEMQQMGIGLAAAILVDATVVRLVLLPALLLVFERQVSGMGRAGGVDHESALPLREPVPVP